MISLSKTELSTEGNVILSKTEKSTINKNTARVVLVPTLDGGSVTIHSGVSESDRDVTIYSDISQEQERTIWSFFNSGAYLTMVCKEGVFFTSIKSLKTDNGKLEMKILILDKEN